MTFLQQLRAIPAGLRRLDDVIDRLLRATNETQAIAESLVQRIADDQAEIEPTFIYVLPPDGTTMMAQRVFVRPGSSIALDFQPYVVIPPLAWVVSVGPATIRGVRVGNQMQTSMPDFQGQICRLADAITPGIRLTVELFG